MFRLDAVSLRFGHQLIFDRLSWQVSPHDRVGLVGPNGAGKTTLLRLLAGRIEADAGRIEKPKTAAIGYLPQDGIVHAGRSLLDELKDVFKHTLALKSKHDALMIELETIPHEDPRFDAVLNEAQDLEDRFRNAGGYQIDADIGQVLRGLGFSRDTWDKPTQTFSGGWQMRIALARLLLARPRLLLLDEPTNHLDLEARIWLASYLKSYPHAIILVAHDRYFLDQICTRIAEVVHKGITDYTGGYSDYLKEKERRLEAMQAAWENQQEEIARIERFIERFRYKASKAVQVQSRIKMLNKIERLPEPSPEVKRMRLRFPEPRRSAEIVLDLASISKSYDGRQVLRHVDLQIRRAERVVLIGPNGAGKSTLMRIMAGIEAPDTGHRRLGEHVSTSYFAQDQATALDPTHTVLEAMSAGALGAGEGWLRTLLGSFLFSGDDVFKRVEVLSGGEKNRLALCRMLARPSNLLLLDEPTNHLDIVSKDILMDALKDFGGTIVFVSHDRAFVDGVATRVIALGGNELVDYPGSFSDYESWAARRLEEHEEGGDRRADSGFHRRAKKNGDDYRARRRASRALARKKEREAAIPDEIEALERTLKALHLEMADPANARDFTKLMALQEESEGIKKEIEALYDEWTSLQEELEALT